MAISNDRHAFRHFHPTEISTYFNLQNRLDAALLSTVRKGNRDELDLSAEKKNPKKPQKVKNTKLNLVIRRLPCRVQREIDSLLGRR